MDKVVALVSGYDDTSAALGCLNSVREAGLSLVYLDGAYQQFLVEGQAPRTASSDLDSLRSAHAGATIISMPEHIDCWPSEAAKKTALLRLAESAHRDADWWLFLDCDERIEVGARSLGRLLGDLDDQVLWCNVNRYRPDEVHNPDGGPMSRLLLASRGLEFRPPMDYEVYLDGIRIAYHDGERVPEDMQWAVDCLAFGDARIRHDRHLTRASRHEQNARYVLRRRAETGRG